MFCLLRILIWLNKIQIKLNLILHLFLQNTYVLV